MIHLFRSLFLILLLAGCATQSTVVVPKPTIRSIAIVPATNPQRYTIFNHNPSVVMFFPIAGLAYSLDGKAKAKLFTDKLAAQFFPGPDITNSVASRLRNLGYAVQILENVARVTGNPDNVDYERLDHSADAVLHLYFSEVGLLSSSLSSQYRPRVNVAGVVHVKGRRDYLYNETIHYGVDAREGKSWAIFADEKFAYPDFEFVINNIEAVRAGYVAGMDAVAQRMSEQIHAAIK